MAVSLGVRYSVHSAVGSCRVRRCLVRGSAASAMTSRHFAAVGRSRRHSRGRVLSDLHCFAAQARTPGIRGVPPPPNPHPVVHPFPSGHC